MAGRRCLSRDARDAPHTQDCALCNLLVAKLETLANNVGMANVCSVPLSFIFMRGQGVKIFSLVAKQCRQDGFLVPTRPKADLSDLGYEGAIVLDPQEGMYLEDPVSVLDYASLYPSSMISENLSHDRCAVRLASCAVRRGLALLPSSTRLFVCFCAAWCWTRGTTTCRASST